MPSTTLIFGGSGKVSRCLTRLLVSQGSTVHSVIRNPAQESELSDLGAHPIVQSIEESSVDDLAQTIKKCKPDVVVWSAGAGGGNPERTEKVDKEGAIKSFDATSQAGVKRYIIVSAIDVRDRENKPVPDWYNEDDRNRSERVWGAIGPYMKAKFAADRDLVTNNSKRGLDYTIIRPGGLSQDPGKGTIAAGKVHLGAMISREDVAAAIVAAMKEPKTIGLAIDMVGGDVPVEEAIRKAAEEKQDAFEGHY